MSHLRKLVFLAALVIATSSPGSSSVFAPFDSLSGKFSPFAESGNLALTILDVTNAQKLALTGITAGQQVRISDAFVLSNDPMGGSGLYYKASPTQYLPVTDSGGGSLLHEEGSGWGDSNGIFTNDDLAEPWLGTDAGTDHAGYIMTHPALQVYLGGTISSEASWSTIDDVADATARLSLLGIPVGKQVHQVDTDTVYQYNGPSTDAVAGMLVAGGDTGDGVYTMRGIFDGTNVYNLIGQPTNPGSNNGISVEGHAPSLTWVIRDSEGNPVDASVDAPATPALATGWATITVTIDHIAALENWSVP